MLQIYPALELPKGFVKIQITGPTPRESDSVDLRWDLRMCISNNFLGHVDASGPETTL